MDAQLRPLPRIGLTLALRLYLLLAAIFLPTFGVYYVYTLRAIEAMHGQEVDRAVAHVTQRIEKCLQDMFLDAMLTEIAPDDPNYDTKVQGQQEMIGRLQERVEGVMADSVYPLNAAVYVADRRGELRFLAGKDAPGLRKPSAEDVQAYAGAGRVQIEVLRGADRFQSVSVPVRYDGQVRGALHLEVSPYEAGASVGGQKRNVLIGVAAMMLILAVGLALFFNAAVRRPIRDLTDAMEKSAGGDLNALVEARSGEFGWLAGSYNLMMRRLKQSVDKNQQLLEQIKRFNEELQQRIRSATEELASKNAQLQAANERLFLLQRQMATQEKLATLGQVATTIAHELGTPLNAISGHLQLLLEDPVADPGTLERLKVINAQVDRLTGIVRDVLKSMRVPAPRMETINVNHVIEDVVEVVDPIARKRRIGLEARLNRDLPLIPADGDQLEQVLMNLFANAMDAMRGGGTLTVATAFVTAEESAELSRGWSSGGAGSHLRIDVSDTGDGMDAETASRAFEPFFTTKGVEGGSAGMGLGLGLSICRQIVRNHRGEITVRSEPGKGTTFSLYLPVERERVLSLS